MCLFNVVATFMCAMYIDRTKYVGCDFFFFQAEDGIRDLVRSRGLGDVYKRQQMHIEQLHIHKGWGSGGPPQFAGAQQQGFEQVGLCLLYTSDAADERSSVDLGGRRIIKKKNK